MGCTGSTCTLTHMYALHIHTCTHTYMHTHTHTMHSFTQTHARTYHTPHTHHTHHTYTHTTYTHTTPHHTHARTHTHACAHTPVEVSPCQRTAIVTNDDPVGVQHWHHLEHKHLPQELGIRVAAGEEVEQALHHPAGVGLSRVDTGSDDNGFLGLCTERGEKRGRQGREGREAETEGREGESREEGMEGGEGGDEREGWGEQCTYFEYVGR